MRDVAHIHEMAELSRTTEGELGILMGCRCSKTEVVWPARKKTAKRRK